MNERIKELADEAEKYALDNVGKGHYGIEDLIYQFQFVDTKMAKFAELIIKECGFYLLETGELDIMGVIDMESHFGVKE